MTGCVMVCCLVLGLTAHLPGVYGSKSAAAALSRSSRQSPCTSQMTNNSLQQAQNTIMSAIRSTLNRYVVHDSQHPQSWLFDWWTDMLYTTLSTVSMLRLTIELVGCTGPSQWPQCWQSECWSGISQMTLSMASILTVWMLNWYIADDSFNGLNVDSLNVELVFRRWLSE